MIGLKLCYMNEEPLVLPDTCGLFLGTGGAGPRALRFSAVPGKSPHHGYNLVICIHIYNPRPRSEEVCNKPKARTISTVNLR